MITSLGRHDHALPLGILVYNLIKLFTVNRATLVDIDGVEALLVALLVPGHVRIRLLHQLLAEVTAFIDVQIPIAIVIRLRKDVKNDGAKLLSRDLGLLR